MSLPSRARLIPPSPRGTSAASAVAPTPISRRARAPLGHNASPAPSGSNRSARSSTVTSWPSRRRIAPAARPPIPAPMITTRIGRRAVGTCSCCISKRPSSSSRGWRTRSGSRMPGRRARTAPARAPREGGAGRATILTAHRPHMLHGVSAEPAVAAESLTVVRGDKEVLHGLSFAVPRGGITGLLGPSGCGKTTLMRCVVGVQVIESGGVDVLGVPAGAAELRARVGYVTQAPSVYGDITVGENLRYFARVLGADAARVGEVIETVALHEHDRVANKLSGGQRSRISLATALLAEPDLLVLDEPTVGLDPVLRVDLWNTFASLAERGTTLLVSSHVMDEAERCDSLLLMRDGDLLATETPDGLRSRTGEQDLEDAFLALIKEREAV